MKANSRPCARIVSLAVGVGLAMLLETAFAHHSFAIFDARQSITLHGVVKEIVRTTPATFAVDG